jgi:hypothetical protein
MLALPLAVYASIGLFFLAQTYVEGIKSKEGGPVLRVVGLLLCLVWPVILLGVAIDVLKARFPFGSATNRLKSPRVVQPQVGHSNSNSAYRKTGRRTTDGAPTSNLSSGPSSRQKVCACKSGRGDRINDEP